MTLLTAATSTYADTQMLVPITPALSPDGSSLIFSWENDLWRISADPKSKDYAERLTLHPGKEYNPIFSPDGKTLYYNSDKEGSTQIFSMPLSKPSEAKQITFHSTTNLLEDITNDGKTVIYSSARDGAGRGAYNAFQAPISADKPEEAIFDAYAQNIDTSPDNTKILFTREGTKPYRVGYHGTQASQIWLYDKATKEFTQPVTDEYGCLSPTWMPDGSGFYYLSGNTGHYNLYKYDFSSEKSTQLTSHTEGNVMFPVMSADGSTIVYRHYFNFYKFDTETNKSEKFDIKHDLSLKSNDVIGRVVNKTDDADFSPSGLEIIFSSNGNIFAMDTVLREPLQLTDTDAHETNLYFGDKGRAIYYIYDDGVKSSINKITKSNTRKYWWEKNDRKTTEVITAEGTTISYFIPSPDGKLIGYATEDGKLNIYNIKTKSTREIVSSWSVPNFQWSPNTEWITYSLEDNYSNSDIYIVPTDGSQDAINISKHPDDEISPAFSPDGKKIAFMGKRDSSNFDLYFVDLTPRGTEKSSRDKKIELARKAMKKDPIYSTPASKLKSVIQKLSPKKSQDPEDEPTKDEPVKAEKPKKEPAKKKPTESPNEPFNSDQANNSSKTAEEKNSDEEKPEVKEKAKFKIKYDLVDVQKRIQRIPLTGVSSTRLYWKHDSKAILIPNARAKATYAYDLKTKKGAKYVDSSGTPIRYNKKGYLYWISNSVPAVLKGTKSTNYTFTTQTTFDPVAHQRHKFRIIWRTIRDGFYDEQLNGLDWNAILDKYEDAATQAQSGTSFDRIVTMLLGELNASHMGFRGQNPSSWRKRTAWKEEMLHLGIHYTPKEDGWHITRVLKNAPANGELTKLKAGEIITEINGTKVDNETLPKDVLWGQLKNTVKLKLVSKEEEERELNLKPISYGAARSLISSEKLANNKTKVDELSNNKLGYLHIASMQWEEFKKFEKHLYENGAGKEGLIIDVRDNGGGFTADHLLTALTQPRHAYTIPRNGGLGYPQDRFVYATWQKPLVVLCNQNSFSNAEIFAHAIKNLKRGKIVGVPTAGGVISTGSASILKQGSLRMPFRGWFLSTDGKDMELNGASPEPENIIWPKPGELETGIDKQLEKAVQVLTEEVKEKALKAITPKYHNRK